jgi:hypothetical protein
VTSRPLVFAVVVALAACRGGPAAPDPTPSPSPSPATVPGGTLEGVYLLRIQPAAGCPAPGSVFTFPMNAVRADTARSPGFQLVIRDSPRIPALEMELMYQAPDVRGGVGTTHEGEMSREGIRVWAHTVGWGGVTTRGSGPGQVLQGTLMGSLAFGRDRDPEGALGACTSLAHQFSLQPS